MLTALLLIRGVVPACAKPVVAVTLSQARVVTAADGTTRLVAMDASTIVTTGLVVRYTMSAKNTGVDPATHLILTGHVPAGTVFVAGSVRGPGGHAEYSLDAKSFSAHPMVSVKNATGNAVMQPADPAQYVLIRWVKDAPLPPGATVSCTYDVKVQ